MRKWNLEDDDDDENESNKKSAKIEKTDDDVDPLDAYMQVSCCTHLWCSQT